jgi:hypothetical protein
MSIMTLKQEEAIATLRATGYCVIVFTPSELGDADASQLEELLVERGNHFIAFHNEVIE